VINSAETITALILVTLSDATPAPCWIRAPRREPQVSRSGPSSPFLTLHPRAQRYDGSADPPDPLVRQVAGPPHVTTEIQVQCRDEHRSHDQRVVQDSPRHRDPPT